jgi:hypothetical protein
VVAVSGDVTQSDAPSGVPMPGAAVIEGVEFETRTGRIALSFGALSLRMDRDTRIRLDEADRVTLLEGNVYVDSGGVNAVSALRIATPAGDVRHVGTQFLVGVTGPVTRVQVREGRVTLGSAQGAVRDVAAGEKLEVGPATVLTRAQAPFGAEWEWAAQTAPVFDIENRPLAEFLAWIAREHGWQLRYADSGLQTQAQIVRLHGSLVELGAEAMIERVSLITGWPMTLADGVLTIGEPR